MCCGKIATNSITRILLLEGVTGGYRGLQFFLFIIIIKIVTKVIANFCLVLVFLASSWVLFQPGFFRAHDYIHATRIVEMTTALNEGHFPVRWSKNLGYGYGMPLFEFYAPLPYLVGAGFYWLGLSAVFSVKLIFFLSSLLTLIGAYKLGAKLSVICIFSISSIET